MSLHAASGAPDIKNAGKTPQCNKIHMETCGVTAACMQVHGVVQEAILQAANVRRVEAPAMPQHLAHPLYRPFGPNLLLSPT